MGQRFGVVYCSIVLRIHLYRKAIEVNLRFAPAAELSTPSHVLDKISSLDGSGSSCTSTPVPVNPKTRCSKA